MTDIHALEAIRLVTRHLPDSVKNPQDVDLRGQIMLGSLEAGLAFSNASLGGVHAMALAWFAVFALLGQQLFVRTRDKA